MKINKNDIKLFFRFLQYLLPYKTGQLVIFALTFVTVGLSLVNPYLSKLIVDNAILKSNLKTFIALGLIGTAVFVFSGLTKAIADFLEKRISLKLKFDLHKKIFTHQQQLPLDFFQGSSTGEQMFKLSYDIERVVDFLSSVPKELVGIFPKLFIILGIIFYLNWQLAVFALILTPILYLPVIYFTGRMRLVWKEWLADSEGIFKRIGEVFSHIYLIKALAREKIEIKKYLQALSTNIKIRLKNIRWEVINSFAGVGFQRIAIVLITFFGGYQVIKGEISPGTLTAIMLYLTQLVGLQSSLAFFGQRLSLGLVSCQRLDEVLQQQPQIAIESAQRELILHSPRIEFRRVSFAYRPDQAVIRELTFSVEKGMVALVGPSGCGKTTILNLILRLYEPQQGAIFISGNNLRDICPQSLRNQIGIALQEPFLWNDTIENNIKYAKEDATEKEIIEVAEATGVDELVRGLSLRYKTVIGENACKLSEGQKQKIALARALIKNPKILILDEAMSSMDSLSEEKIVDQIKKMPVNIVIIVSHRLSTVMNCELAYFLKKPDEILVDGPKSLLEQDAQFGQLFAAQKGELAQKR